jgi:hypothetical protein
LDPTDDPQAADVVRIWNEKTKNITQGFQLDTHSWKAYYHGTTFPEGSARQFRRHCPAATRWLRATYCRDPVRRLFCAIDAFGIWTAPHKDQWLQRKGLIVEPLLNHLWDRWDPRRAYSILKPIPAWRQRIGLAVTGAVTAKPLSTEAFLWDRGDQNPIDSAQILFWLTEIGFAAELINDRSVEGRQWRFDLMSATLAIAAKFTMRRPKEPIVFLGRLGKLVDFWISILFKGEGQAWTPDEIAHLISIHELDFLYRSDYAQISTSVNAMIDLIYVELQSLGSSRDDLYCILSSYFLKRAEAEGVLESFSIPGPADVQGCDDILRILIVPTED